MRWFEVSADLDTDPRVAKLLLKFKNKGFGVLMRLWALIARRGERPGIAIDADGQPFDLRFMAQQVGASQKQLAALLKFCALPTVALIDRDLWKQRTVSFPLLAQATKRYHAKTDSARRVEAHRRRHLDRIAERDGRKCCHCGAENDRLELEKRIPRAEGGGVDDDNQQITCVRCARKRRAKKRSKKSLGKTQEVTQGVTQDGTETVVPVSVPSTGIDLQGHPHHKRTYGRLAAAAARPSGGEDARVRVPLSTTSRLSRASAGAPLAAGAAAARRKAG